MVKDFGAYLIGCVYLAMLFVLVRPGSQGPTLVTNVASGLQGLITAGTGGGTWASGGTTTGTGTTGTGGTRGAARTTTG